MSQEIHSIPTTPTAQYAYQRNFMTRVIAAAVAWGVPAAKLTAIAPLRATYELAFAVADNRTTQSPQATSARESAWVAYLPSLTDILDHNIINNVLISAADKKALNIHYTNGNGGTPTPAPTTAPVVSMVSEEISVVHVVYAAAAAPTTHCKPDGVAFCEMVYLVGTTPPATIAACVDRYNVARSHEGIMFEPAQRGQNIYAYARWVNKNGKTGPWSGMITALIP